MIRESVAYLVSQGMEVIYDAEHSFDGFKGNEEYALKTWTEAAKAGARLVVLCDTNGGTMPAEIASIAKRAREAVEPLGAKIGIHCHNDCELAVANSLAAVEAGAVQVQGTINGLGERCGNVDLISVVGNLALKFSGYEVLGGEHFASLTELSRFVYEVANIHLPQNNQPFVGASAFAHKGGMHVHAIARSASSYEHIDPESGRQRAADSRQRTVGPFQHHGDDTATRRAR